MREETQELCIHPISKKEKKKKKNKKLFVLEFVLREGLT
jgi:hypothetical protein